MSYAQTYLARYMWLRVRLSVSRTLLRNDLGQVVYTLVLKATTNL